MARILLVDDESSLLRSMQLQLTRAGHECACAETIAQAADVLASTDPDLAIVDVRLPDGNGVDLVRRIRSEGRTFPIVVLTAFGSISNAVAAMREGTNDYIEKPIDLEQLTFVVQRNLETERLKDRIELYERSRSAESGVTPLIGESPPFQDAVRLAKKVASPGVSEAAEMPTVLLTGETGSGKDVLARYIHEIGPLGSQPMVHVDCANLPRELIESELFGHERGAFTDARSAKRGLLEIASGGTVFLNEIGEMPIDLQAKLLSALENKAFRRVGGTRDQRFNARIIAATNADLAGRVQSQTFREDLYYRLNVFNIHLPPLRDRSGDVILLAEHFIHQMCRKYRKPPASLTKEARQTLQAYHWPGNVRELRHVIERAALLVDKELIEPSHLGILPTTAPNQSTPTDQRGKFDSLTLPQMETRMIDQALERSGGNVSQAARLLGISRGALRRRLESRTDRPSQN